MGVGISGRRMPALIFGGLFSLVATDVLAQMEEMVVSARQREQNLQEVPVAVTAFGAEEIDRLNIDRLDSLAKYNSSLIFDQGFASQDTRITLRGLAPTRGRQNVAVLVDGIDITTGQAIQTNGGGLLLNPRLFDLERIEVVKGPQNALFGRSAFAGAINYITRKPGDELEGTVFTDAGENGQFELRAGLRGPLTESISAGLNFATWQHDGYYDNSVTGSSVGGVDGKGFSASLKWDIFETLSATIQTSYTDEDIDQSPYFSIAPTVQVPIPASAIGTVISPDLPSIEAVRGDFPNGNNTPVTLSENPRTGNDYPGTDLEIWRSTLTVNAQVAEGIEIVSLTHYADTDSNSFEDSRREGSVSGLGTNTGPRPVGGEFAVEDDLELFSQDVRLQSFGNDYIDWAVGAQYWKEEQKFTDLGINCISNELFPFAPAGDCAAALAGIVGKPARFGDPWDRETDYWAVYGLVEIQLLEQWRLLLEGRYASEDTEITGPIRSGCTTGDAERPRAIDPRGLPFPGQFPANLSPNCGSLTENEGDSYFAPKVTVQWDPTDNMMYYFSIAATEKPAGISVTGALSGFNPEASKFDSEELTVYELGAKTSWFDDTVVLNGAVYYQDFDDKLLTSQKADASGVLFPAPVNASGAEVWGFELDAVWQAADWLSFNASYTYLDTEYTDYKQLSAGPAPIADAGNCTVRGPDGAGGFDCELDLSDNELEFAPEHSFVFGTQLRAGFFDTGVDWFLDTDVVYQDERWTSAFNTVKLDEYTVVDLRAGLASESIEAMFYIDNVFDEDTLQSTFANTDNAGIRAVGIPPGTPPFTFVLPLNQTPILPDERQYGVRVIYRFSGN